MTIPVRCSGCNSIAHLKRLAYAWVTFCGVCRFAEIKYDIIHMGQEEQR